MRVKVGSRLGREKNNIYKGIRVRLQRILSVKYAHVVQEIERVGLVAYVLL